VVLLGNACVLLGNASQISDGAAALVLARRSYARTARLPLLGVFRSYAVVGVPPDIMGVGPVHAIPRLLHQSGTSSSAISQLSCHYCSVFTSTGPCALLDSHE